MEQPGLKAAHLTLSPSAVNILWLPTAYIIKSKLLNLRLKALPNLEPSYLSSVIYTPLGILLSSQMELIAFRCKKYYMQLPL